MVVAGGKTTLVLVKQWLGRGINSGDGLGRSTGSNPVLYKKGCGPVVCWARGKGLGLDLFWIGFGFVV